MSSVLTKSVFINYINETIGLSKRESQIFFETFLQFICDSLKEKEDVKIVNFGIFKIRSKKARVGRNPKTKVEVTISPRNVITFKASEYLNGLINSNSSSEIANERK